MSSAATQFELDQKFASIPHQLGIKVVDQGYLANADESVRLEIAQIPSGVHLIYVDSANRPIIDPTFRPGLVDILFDRLGEHTVITFIFENYFENYGFWSGLKLHGTTLRTVFRGPFAAKEDLMSNLNQVSAF